ncbi:MAG: RcnB family protein [Caulobacteraceae bacterium]
MLSSASLAGAIVGILTVAAVAAHSVLDMAFRAFGADRQALKAKLFRVRPERARTPRVPDTARTRGTTMNKLLSAAFAATIALTSVSAAFAQPGRNNDHHDNNQGHGGYVRHDDWRKGHRLSKNDWSRGQHVDYRAHHLRAPPRGYEWREVDGNYVMAAAATGLIASIIANAH